MPERSYPKGLQKREEILREALSVIARVGYHRTTIRELADAVGLSTAGLQHHFTSKDDLFVAVLRARDAADGEGRSARFEGNPLAGFADGISHNSAVPGLVQLYVRFSAEATEPSHPAHQYFTERWRVLRAALAEAVRRGQASGEYRLDIEPERAAEMLIAIADGAQAQWLMEPAIDMGAQVGEFINVLRAIDAPKAAVAAAGRGSAAG